MANKKVVVRSWDEALDVLDGKKLVLDGVDGVLRVRRRRDQYGPVLTGVLMHVPSAKGKQSAKYLETKRQLHDDWDTDLTGSERAGEIAERFVTFAPQESDLNYLRRAWVEADDAWGKELRRLFGKQAGDVRYTKQAEGMAGTVLRSLYEKRVEAGKKYDEEAHRVSRMP